MDLLAQIAVCGGEWAKCDPRAGASVRGTVSGKCRRIEMALPAAPTMTKAEEKRRSLRDHVFPNCTDELWNRKLVTGGFTTIPRTLGLIMTLIEQLADRKKGKDVSRTYFELWCRAFDDYFIDAGDVEGFAFAAGFVTRGRNVRSWEERIRELGNLGFIRIAPNGTRRQGY